MVSPEVRFPEWLDKKFGILGRETRVVTTGYEIQRYQKTIKYGTEDTNYELWTDIPIHL